MATVIDSLLVTLGLDASGLSRGKEESKHSLDELRVKVDEVGKHLSSLKAQSMATAADVKNGVPEAATSYHKLQSEISKVTEEERKLQGQIKHVTAEFAEQGNKVKEVFSESKKVLMELVGLAGLGLAVGKFVGFIEKTTEAAVVVSRLSKEAHIGVEEVQAWQSVVAKFGGSAEGVASSIEHLGMRMSMLGTKLHGAKRVTMALAQIGISEIQVKGKETGQVLEIISDKLKGMEFYKARKMTSLLGIDDPGLIRAMVQGGDELQKALSSAKKNALNEEDIEAMHRYHESQIAISKSFSNIKKHVVADLMPALELLTKLVEKGAKFLKDNRKTIEAGILAIGAVTLWLGRATLATGIKMASGWLIAQAPLIPYYLAIAAIVTILTYLIVKFREWREGGESAFSPLFAYLQQGFTQLMGMVEDVGAIFKDVWDFIVGVVTGDDDKILKALGNLWEHVVDLLDIAVGWMEYRFWVLYYTIEKIIKKIPGMMKENLTKGLGDVFGNLLRNPLLRFNPVTGPVMGTIGATRSLMKGASNEGGPTSVDNSKTATTTINGPVTIQTQATNAPDLAKDLSWGTFQIAGGFN